MSNNFFPENWKDYELIDSGDGEKLERYKDFLIISPAPKALWKKTLPTTKWNEAYAKYTRSDTGGGNWEMRDNLTFDTQIQWNNTLKFNIKPFGFKHTGVFPEQANMWQFIIDKLKSSSKKTPNVLNLFAYTGGSSLAALHAGASVTHLDSSKEIIEWGKKNAVLSGLRDKPIRWIIDDALKFVKREINRGVKYDGIIMDPPKFGRGAKGEIWKIEDDLSELIGLCKEILSPEPTFFIVNAYAIDISASTLNNLLIQNLEKYCGNFEFGELSMKHSSNNLVLSTGIFARWSAD